MNNIPEQNKKWAHAYIDGADVEFRNHYEDPRLSGAWFHVIPMDMGVFADPSCEFRLAPKRPSINWDHVASGWNYLSENGNGSAYLYREKPELGSYYWKSPSILFAKYFTSFKPGTCDWKDSLVTRPGVEE